MKHLALFFSVLLEYSLLNVAVEMNTLSNLQILLTHTFLTYNYSFIKDNTQDSILHNRSGKNISSFSRSSSYVEITGL